MNDVVTVASAPSERISRLHVVAGIACGLALAVDMIEMALGGALSTVFLAPPYSLGTTGLSLLVAAVYLGAVLGAPMFGWLSDRHGIRRSLVIALGWLAVATIFSAAAPDMVWLGVLRFLCGLSLGAIPPLLIAYLTQIAPPARRGLLIFWVCGLAALAPPLGIMAVRWLLTAEPWGIASWRWPLIAAAVLSAVAAGLFRGLPDGHAAPSDSPGGTRVAHASIPPPASPSSRRLLYVCAIYFLFPWAAVGFPLLTGPVLLLRGFDVSRALLFVALTTVGPTVASLITGAFVDKLGRRTTLCAAAALMIAAVLLFALCRSPSWVGGALVLFGLAGAIYVTALTLYAAEIFPSNVRTFATSTAWACNRAAAVVVPIALLAVITPRDSLLPLLPIVMAMVASMMLIGVGPRGAAGRAVD
jgi:MFS transporter, putative metabolite:H+ symporter